MSEKVTGITDRERRETCAQCDHMTHTGRVEHIRDGHWEKYCIECQRVTYTNFREKPEAEGHKGEGA